MGATRAGQDPEPLHGERAKFVRELVPGDVVLAGLRGEAMIVLDIRSLPASVSVTVRAEVASGDRVDLRMLKGDVVTVRTYRTVV